MTSKGPSRSFQALKHSRNASWVRQEAHSRIFWEGCFSIKYGFIFGVRNSTMDMKQIIKCVFQTHLLTARNIKKRQRKIFQWEMVSHCGSQTWACTCRPRGVADSGGLGWTSNKSSGHDEAACRGTALTETSGSKNLEES